MSSKNCEIAKGGKFFGEVGGGFNKYYNATGETNEIK